jgi:hypothetical protein
MGKINKWQPCAGLKVICKVSLLLSSLLLIQPIQAGLTLDEVRENYSPSEILAAIRNSTSEIETSPHYLAAQDNERLRSIFRYMIKDPIPPAEIVPVKDYNIVKELPDHRDIRFMLPDLLLERAVCTRVMSLYEDDPVSNAVTAATLMQSVDVAKQRRITSHYQNVLSSLSAKTKTLLEQAMQYWPIQNQQGAFVDTVALATEVPLYSAWQISEGCHNTLRLSTDNFSEVLLADVPVRDTPHDAAQSASYPGNTPAPSFDGEILTIPFVRQPEKEGSYQQIRLKEGEDGLWDLQEVKEISYIRHIEQVSIVRTEDLPQQVLLKIDGRFNGCHSLGRAVKYLDEVTGILHVDVYNKSPDPGPEDMCSAVITQYEILEPLPVNGMTNGIQQVIVNNRFETSFLHTGEQYHSGGAGVSEVLYADIDNAPYLEGNKLHIPTLDTPALPGQYQGVEFTQLSDGRWQLSSVAPDRKLVSVNRVELDQSAQLPVQVIMKINVNEKLSCLYDREIVTRYEEESQTFEVSLFKQEGDKETDSCVLMGEAYEAIYPLPVLGLPAGTYHVKINGSEEATFTLYQDNDFITSGIWQPLSRIM